MKKNQPYKNLNYDFSDYAEEITGNALFEINGGAEIENSDKGVAGAKTEAGGGIGQSGSVSLSIGNFNSLDDAKGAYTAFGGSGGPTGTSIGLDIIKNLKNEYAGSVISLGELNE